MSDRVIFLSILLKCFYACGDLEGRFVRKIARQMSDFFGIDDVFLVNPLRSGAVYIRFDELGDLDLAKVCGSKEEVVISDKKGEIFSCTLIPSNAFTSDGGPHNQLELYMNECFMLDDDMLSRLPTFAAELAQDLMADFCFVCDITSSDCKYGMNRAGLTYGLRDVYWVNIYGKLFVNMIGKDNLLRLSAVTYTKALSDSLVLVQIDRLESNREQKERVKCELGTKYFIKSHEHKPGSVSTGGPVAFVKLLLKLRNQKVVYECAEEKPVFEQR